MYAHKQLSLKKSYFFYFILSMLLSFSMLNFSSQQTIRVSKRSHTFVRTRLQAMIDGCLSAAATRYYIAAYFSNEKNDIADAISLENYLNLTNEKIRITYIKKFFGIKKSSPSFDLDMMLAQKLGINLENGQLDETTKKDFDSWYEERRKLEQSQYNSHNRYNAKSGLPNEKGSLPALQDTTLEEHHRTDTSLPFPLKKQILRNPTTKRKRNFSSDTKGQVHRKNPRLS